ncbi:MAG: DsbA family protein [Chloroflexi bacterium]|nr:DsbA family protein [Chloroflexota bacterium]
MNNQNFPTQPEAKKTRAKKISPIIQEEEIIDVEMIEAAEETVTFKRSHFYAVLVVLAFAVGVLVGYVAWGRETVTAAPAPAAAPVAQQSAATAAPQFRRYDIPTDGYPSLGPDDAQIVIVEFSDYQCPYCRKFHDETYQALLNAYPGQIRFVYRNLPLTSIHPSAMPAAIASLCANDQNAYWDYHEKLFSSESLDEATYIQYAADLGLNVDTFTACLSSGSHDAFIQEDMNFAIDLGVQSTPTFFINGLAIVGAQPLANFQQVIDKELAGEIP